MKGCLKLPSPMPTPGIERTGFYSNSNSSTTSTSSECSTTHRKCVAFGPDGTEQVYTADEWDRTPTEPAKKLSYQDLLELNQIQRSLPRADQPSDLITGRPARQYLSTVPIGLLPLLPDTTPAYSPSPLATYCTNFQQQQQKPISHPSYTSSTTPGTSPYRPPAHLSHLVPSRPLEQRQKPAFSFLPLLDPPPPPSSCDSDTDASSLDPPTPSLTNASLDSSPRSSRASSPCPSLDAPLPPLTIVNFKRQDPGYFAQVPGQPLVFNNLPPLRSNVRLGMHAPFAGAPLLPVRLEAVASPLLVPPSPLALEPPAVIHPKPQKKRNFIIINDMEFELDGDDDDDNNADEQQEADEQQDDASPKADDTALSEPPSTESAPVSLLLSPDHTPPAQAIDITKSSFSIPLSPSSSSSSLPAKPAAHDPPSTPPPSAHTSTHLPSPPASPPSRTASLGSPTSTSSSPPRSGRWSPSFTSSAAGRCASPSKSPPTSRLGGLNLHMPVRFKRAGAGAGSS